MDAASGEGSPRIERPVLTPPGPEDHKYTRGLVTVIGGAMAGAAALAALGAARSGAGYVQLLSPEPIGSLPHAIVQQRYASAGEVARMVADDRIGAVVLGPGLGTGAEATALVAAVSRSGRPLVLDADALGLLDLPLAGPAILTPHAGEFARVFGPSPDDRVEGARDAARRAGAVLLLKGSVTIVAAPDERTALSHPLPAALASAGTGDVLAGICGTMLAQLDDPFDAACAAVWLHGEAARLAGGPLVADDLAATLPAAVRACW